MSFCLLCLLLGLVFGCIPASAAQICEAQGWRSYECRELSSLQELIKVKAFPTDNWHRLSIKNQHTEFSIGTASSAESLSSLSDLDLSQVPQLLLQRRGFSILPQLKHLNISGCGLTQLLGTHFASESALQMLDASNNGLSTLTKDVFSNLRKLIYVNLTQNALQEFAMPPMAQLQQLDLSHNALLNVSLSACAHLEQLLLNDNQLEQLDALSFRGLNTLQHLQLSYNSLSNIGKDTFQPLVQLRRLNISHNVLGALRPQVFGSAAVQSFSLQQLDLSGNSLRLLFDNQFRLLAKLQLLDLSQNSIASLSSPHFAGLSSLRKLYLQSNDILEIKPHTFAALVDLDTLDLSYNNIESLDDDAFGSKTLPRLRKLNLNANNLKRLHALAFSSLPFVEYLSLGNNDLRNLDVRMFLPMRQLQKLHLGHNEITEIDRDVLSSLSSVQELLIDNNKLTFLPYVNDTLPQLKRVAIEGNPWQCACFVKLERWLQSKQVTYLREGTGYYDGEKPLCAVTSSNHCVQSVEADQHLDVRFEFEQLHEARQSEEDSAVQD
ncbi:CG6749 [Drosophila busckii]|uniref:CG6749 n=1 Tax=Drosophila busckii TaxID=30019 RepID=A0A0M4EJK8_DROBS|nr:carboxypeptidase N subunit 2 [Drosophila busckii]ALC44226.1 CG6749 [Drosophila busckii]